MATMPNLSGGFDFHIPTGVTDAAKRVREAVPSLGTILGGAVVLGFFGPYLLMAAATVVTVATGYMTLFRKHSGKPYVPYGQ
jgi:hypothetical protein